jgi:hypothetical protein
MRPATFAKYECCKYEQAGIRGMQPPAVAVITGNVVHAEEEHPGVCKAGGETNDESNCVAERALEQFATRLTAMAGRQLRLDAAARQITTEADPSKL